MLTDPVLRFLLWLWATLLVVNGAVASVAFPEGIHSGRFFLGLVALLVLNGTRRDET